jgi:hypothetical protein
MQNTAELDSRNRIFLQILMVVYTRNSHENSGRPCLFPLSFPSKLLYTLSINSCWSHELSTSFKWKGTNLDNKNTSRYGTVYHTSTESRSPSQSSQNYKLKPILSKLPNWAILHNTVAYLLQARTAEQEKQPLLGNGSEPTIVSGQRFGKHVPESTNEHATIELLLEKGVFSMWSLPRAVGTMS